MTEPLRRCDHSIEGAAAVLRRLRAATLDYGSISLTQSFVLDRGASMTREQLIHQLEEQGLITTGADGRIEITVEGTTRYEQVTKVRDDVHVLLYAGVTPEQLATTVSVLDAVIQQAQAAHTLIRAEANPTA